LIEFAPPRQLNRSASSKSFVKTFPRALADFRKLVNARGAALRKLNYGELRNLHGRIENVIVKSRPATIATIVETKTDNSLRVVLQGFMPARVFPSIKSVALDGFYKYPDGTVKPMPEDEFYEVD
jgi:hypothetical protein